MTCYKMNGGQVLILVLRNREQAIGVRRYIVGINTHRHNGLKLKSAISLIWILLRIHVLDHGLPKLRSLLVLR